MNITSDRFRNCNGCTQSRPQGSVLSGVTMIKAEDSTETAIRMRSCADRITEQPVMSARVNMNTPAAAPAMTSTCIEKYCASDTGKEKAGQYSDYYMAVTSTRGSAKAPALGKQSPAVSSRERRVLRDIVA